MLLNIRPPVCLSAHVNCGKTADCIRMPFGVVSGVGLGMGVLDFGGDRRRGRGSLGVNFRDTVYSMAEKTISRVHVSQVMQRH